MDERCKYGDHRWVPTLHLNRRLWKWFPAERYVCLRSGCCARAVFEDGDVHVPDVGMVAVPSIRELEPGVTFEQDERERAA